jgi:hypothetical protein
MVRTLAFGGTSCQEKGFDVVLGSVRAAQLPRPRYAIWFHDRGVVLSYFRRNYRFSKTMPHKTPSYWSGSSYAHGIGLLLAELLCT